MAYDEPRANDAVATTVVVLLALLVLGLLLGGGLYFVFRHRTQRAMVAEQQAVAALAAAKQQAMVAQAAENERLRASELQRSTETAEPTLSAPAHGDVSATPETGSPALQLTMDGDGSLWHNGEMLAADERRAAWPHYAGQEVQLRVAEDCPLVKVAELLQELQQAGLHNVHMRLAAVVAAP
jgi:biopolymer transport protein ExbD